MASLKASNGIMFTREKETFTLRQYCEMYKHSFPSFMMVTQGFYGTTEMEVLANGQVLRIHQCVYQKRAVAIDSHNRTLTIPASYPVKFRVVGANNKVGKGEDTIGNIIMKKPLPVKVQVSDSKKISFNMNNAVHNVYTLGILSINDVYEETYFLANAITSDGKLHFTASLIPLYLGDILVTPVTGIQGKPQTAWHAYQTDTTEECKKVQIPFDTGLKEIALYSPQSVKSSDNVYDYIEPSSYIYVNWDGDPKCDVTQTVTRKSRRPPPPIPVEPPTPLLDPIEKQGPPTIPRRDMKSQPLQDRSKSDKPSPPYANQIERATVAPFTQIAEDAVKKATGIGVKGQSQIKAAEDKPVNKLSIEELGDRMKDLKLDKYVKSFKEQGVDGELALDLSESILQEDFKFSKFESMKFLKFIRSGHVPK